MDMSNSVTIAAPPARVWDALNDPETLKRCINGCESIEKTADNAYKVAMTVAIGPVKAKFKGDLMLENIEPPTAYTIRFSGQGGVAGFGKGSARVTLTPDAATNGTQLDYTVDAQVGGKIAQVGSRLIDGASRKMADDFFNAFRREVEGPAATAPTVTTVATGSVDPLQSASGMHDATASDYASASHETAHSAHSERPVPSSAEAVERLVLQGLSNERWTWLAIAVAVASTVLLLKR